MLIPIRENLLIPISSDAPIRYHRPDVPVVSRYSLTVCSVLASAIFITYTVLSHLANVEFSKKV
jgi:hypothetical protein